MLNVTLTRKHAKGQTRVRSDLSSDEDELDEERRATKERRAKMTLRELLDEMTTDGGGVQLGRESVKGGVQEEC